MKSIYKGNRVTCSDHGWSTLSSCADFVGTFEECRAECTERPNVSQNSNMRNVSGDWGGISFQCAQPPFASATGDKEEDMEDDIISEPPWWLVATAGFLGGLKKYKTCTCTNPENGTTMAITDCPVIRKCAKCCSSRWAGWVGEDSVQNVGQSRR